MSLEHPLINGFRYDWSSIELRTKNKRRKGFTEVSYTTSREHGKVGGAGDRRVGRTRGQVSDEASITMNAEDARELISELGADFGTKPFDVVVSYSEGARTKTDTIRGACIKSVGNAHQRGSDGLVVKLDLDPMEILIDNRRI
jgi:hypothetical protein